MALYPPSRAVADLCPFQIAEGARISSIPIADGPNTLLDITLDAQIILKNSKHDVESPETQAHRAVKHSQGHVIVKSRPFGDP